jgi:hypothetical protein
MGSITQGRPDLADQVGQVGVDHERIRPERLIQRVLGQGFRPRFQEADEELVGLRRQHDLTSIPEQPPPVGIDLTFVEPDSQVLVPLAKESLRAPRAPRALPSISPSPDGLDWRHR